MEGDRRWIEDRRLLIAQLVRDLEHALDRVHNVGRIAALGVVAVLPVNRLASVVFADVVAALDTFAADAAAGVRGAGHPIPHRPAEVLGIFTDRDDVARPFVARGERKGFGPEALEIAFDDVRVGAADRDRPDSRKDFEAAGARNLDLSHLKAPGAFNHQRLHGRLHLDDGQRVDHRSRSASNLEREGDKAELVYAIGRDLLQVEALHQVDPTLDQ